MRISSQQIYDVGVQSLQTQMGDVIEYQRQISSGQRFAKASDNAMAAGLSVQVSLKRSEFDMYKVNQQYITNSLSASDAQLNSIQRMLANFQQMMVQAANDTLGSSNRQMLGNQAQVIRKSVEQFASAKDANGLAILKTGEITSVLVAPSLVQETGISYQSVMGQNPTGVIGTVPAGLVDILATLTSVENTLALGNKPDATQIGNISEALKQVTNAQAKVGILQNQLDASTEAATFQQETVESNRSTLMDTNLADATANLARSNALLQAVQSIISRLDTNSLFSKL